jgi:hypothetical protein
LSSIDRFLPDPDVRERHEITVRAPAALVLEVARNSERAVWERDFASVGEDLPRLEAFFGALLDGKLSEEERNRQGMSFISTEEVPQGGYYTVGWLMSAVVERKLGRKRSSNRSATRRCSCAITTAPRTRR